MIRLLLSTLFPNWSGETAAWWHLLLLSMIPILSFLGLVHVIRCYQLPARLKKAWEWVAAPSAGEDDGLVEALRYGLKFFIVIPFAGVMFLILLKIGKMVRQYLF